MTSQTSYDELINSWELNLFLCWEEYIIKLNRTIIEHKSKIHLSNQ